MNKRFVKILGAIGIAFIGGTIMAMSDGVGTKMTAKADDLKWMAGNWSCEIWGGTFEESWLSPLGGTLQGTGRFISEGKVQFMEFMSIEPNVDGKLTMYMLLGSPSKGNKEPSPFVLISEKEGSYTFENAKNDYPTRIIYSNKKDAQGPLMHVKLEGKQDGKDQVDEFNFRPKK